MKYFSSIIGSFVGIVVGLLYFAGIQNYMFGAESSHNLNALIGALMGGIVGFSLAASFEEKKLNFPERIFSIVIISILFAVIFTLIRS
jgi:uncharacterized protein YacL